MDMTKDLLVKKSKWCWYPFARAFLRATDASDLTCIWLPEFPAFLLRVLYLIYEITIVNKCELTRPKSLRTILCIGSGGHTTELLRLVKNLNTKKYQPRVYILADNDVSSEVKIHETEMERNDYTLSRIPRSRNREMK
ncbi:hypothetical protein HW555_000817 [Spodoptera exigua]|uniref:UDP-N-acetylglucosamine transferase subunit ALG14 n=1 Tax=Spodoptera exigua TaxID=7107 RepID=A0A835GRA9_SPOEX|nr:hypothetical protein HW555_000817 [Spodoptera exigua]